MIDLPVPSWDSRIPIAIVFAWDAEMIMFGYRRRSLARVWRRETRALRRLPRLSIGLGHIFLFTNRDPQHPLRRHIHLEI